MAPKPKLKLYVVGEASGDPSEWSGFSARTLVFARSAKEAGRMVTYHGAGIAEVRVTAPTVLLSESEVGGEN